MKYKRIMKMFSILVVLALLITIIPATPAFAATLVLSTASAKIGDPVTVIGAGFSASQPIAVYFSNQLASIGHKIQTNVTVYQTLFVETADVYGGFTKSATVPSRMTSMGNVDVVAGTYYLYACILTATDPNAIYAVQTFTVAAAGSITSTPTTGPVDTPVTITGNSFVASTAITAQYDGAALPIEGGHTTTQTTGTFSSTVYIPESTAGAHTISVTVGTTSVSSTFTVTRDILINPQSGAAGTQVTISGTGFTRRPAVTFYFNGSLVQEVASYLSDTKGSFSAIITIPSSGLSAGPYIIEADDGTGIADASFNLTVAPQSQPTPEPEPEPEPEPTPTPVLPTLTISSGGNTVGSNIGIGGAGFTPAATVTFTYDDEEVATATADSDGLVMAIFRAPPSKHGEHIITVSDGTNTNTVTYTVESIAPEIPQPLTPELGVKVKSPATFEWEDVTDDSMPVTYTLQIATSDSFEASSIVLEITDIKLSTYMLTEAEELKLAGRKDAYYWRVQAVDAASNESGWTGTGDFYVGGASGSFPSWALYTLIGIGGVLLFGLGYWLGRRTAFYY
jgi:hypothetical protein